MPFYCYKTEDGRIVERFFRMGQAPRQIMVNGKPARRSIAAEHGGFKHRPDLYRDFHKKLFTVGWHPSQRKEAMDALRKLGVPTYVDKNGVPHITSRNHWIRFLNAMGYVNRDEVRGTGERKRWV